MEGARLARVSASMATAAGWFFTRHPFSGGVSRMSGITSAIASSGTAWVGSSSLHTLTGGEPKAFCPLGL